MYHNCAADDLALFTESGIIGLTKRGASVKLAPKRWQDTKSEAIVQHDVIVAFEERIFDAVIEDLQMREPTDAFAPLHVICLDTKDNPAEAKRQGAIALELCWQLEHCDDLMTDIPDIVESMQSVIDDQKSKSVSEPNDAPPPSIKVLYQLCYL
jgi:hypothetical protein